MKLQSVTFDLDGTLLDTALDITVACNRMFRAMALPERSETEIRNFVGRGMEELVTKCLTWDAPPAPEAVQAGVQFFRQFYEEENGRAARPYPGVVEGLQGWLETGLPLAVVTNKSLAFTEPLMEMTGLAPYFQLYVCGDSTPYKKPHPGPVLHACEALGVAPEANLHIGDSLNDVAAARAAGSLAWLVPYGYTEGKPVDSADCDALVSDLLAALRQARSLI